MYLLMDTETTGLSFYGSEHPADAPYQPRMCSIACALLDAEYNQIGGFSSLVQPGDWPLEDPRFAQNMEQAKAIHGLSIEMLQAEGRQIVDLHMQWQDLYDKATYVAGYNVWFDHKIVRGEWKRIGHPIPFRDRQGICLMKASRKAIGGRNPKLAVAVETILGRQHENSHRSDADLAATVELFRVLHARGETAIDDQPEAKPAKDLAA